MIHLTELEQFLNHFLQVAAITDYTPNGVQIRGRESINKVIGGVSACLDLFQAAADQQADLLLVHHGVLWNKDSCVVEGNLKSRLKFLLMHDLTLMAYHLPLDCHAECGNNALILKNLNLKSTVPFGAYHGLFLSFLGENHTKEPFEVFLQRVKHLFGEALLVLPFGPPMIQKVAVCSGAAPELIREAKAAGADLFLSGEATEWVYHYAREEGIHFIGAGHHQTEKFGVQAIGELIAKKFDLEFQFIDIPNPI